MADLLLDRLLTGEKHRNRIVRRRAAAVRLRHVLFNLAGNGIKFTETGGVAVIVKRDGAVVDREFRTTDVLIVLPAEAIKKRYIEHFAVGRSAA